jgi:DNA-binding transcriptional LysR family regulator
VDIELLRTFLEVSRTLHFGHAADNLCITQSAVSARIRQLEQAIGSPLFTRARNNIQLTPTGQRLFGHAESIVNTWNRVRQEVSTEDNGRTPLTVGGVPSLWDILLQDWIHKVYRELPGIALSTEVLGGDTLLRRLQDGTLDLAFLFEVPQTAALAVEQIATTRLVMVSSHHGLSCADAVRRDYVFVDWGTSYAIAHAEHFPDMSAPALRAGLGRLAHAFLIECGGSAYLAESMVSRELDDHRLFPVEDAPVIDRSVYAVYPTDSGRRKELKRALGLVRDVDPTR